MVADGFGVYESFCTQSCVIDKHQNICRADKK